jgi:hypothetical protein
MTDMVISTFPRTGESAGESAAMARRAASRIECASRGDVLWDVL